MTLRPLFQIALAVIALLMLATLLPERRPARPVALERTSDGARYRLTEHAAREASVRVLPKPGPLQFAEDTPPADRQAVLAAVAAGRPEARRLVELVSGTTHITVGFSGRGAVGATTALPGGGYDVHLDLGRVYARNGLRGIARVTWHELGHVVDDALVTTQLERRLDALTPRGWGCDHGDSGACANRAERFAESFAKWATRDIGLDIYLGYRVPPPDVETWGAPLAVFGR